MKKPVVLCVIDDDDVYQFTITRTLKKTAVSKRILVFSDGEEAIDFFETHLSKADDLPDVVFLDINMPVMDGWDFLEEYVKLKPNLPKPITIYMVSSSVDARDREKARAITEVSDYIVKPLSEDKINDILIELST